MVVLFLVFCLFVCLFNLSIFIYLCFWLCWVFVAARGLSLVVASGGYCFLRCTGFSLRCLLLLRSTALRAQASVVVACGLSSCGLRALEFRLSSCGTQAQLVHGMWDLPGPGLELMSPALAGGFLTTAPPGKSYSQFFEEPPYCFPQWLNQLTFPPTVQKGSLFSTPSPAFVICRLFNDGHSDQCEAVPHCSFDLHFSNNQ